MQEYTVRVYGHDYQEWLQDGHLHHEDGPAIIRDDHEEWWLNGERHKEDGPAVLNSGYQAWYYKGKRHREDGPAVIDHIRGYIEYWIHGEQLSEDEFNNRNTKELSVAEINELLGFKVKVVDK